MPHVTLARLKRPYDSTRWLKPELAEAAGDFAASHLTLYRSELGADKEGARRLCVPLGKVRLRRRLASADLAWLSSAQVSRTQTS